MAPDDPRYYPTLKREEMSRTYADVTNENRQLRETLDYITEESLDIGKEHADDIASMNVRIERLVGEVLDLEGKLRHLDSKNEAFRREAAGLRSDLRSQKGLNSRLHAMIHELQEGIALEILDGNSVSEIKSNTISALKKEIDRIVTIHNEDVLKREDLLEVISDKRKKINDYFRENNGLQDAAKSWQIQALAADARAKVMETRHGELEAQCRGLQAMISDFSDWDRVKRQERIIAALERDVDGLQERIDLKDRLLTLLRQFVGAGRYDRYVEAVNSPGEVIRDSDCDRR